jgi:hypothetical protein
MLQGIYVIKIVYRESDINKATAEEAFKSFCLKNAVWFFRKSF